MNTIINTTDCLHQVRPDDIHTFRFVKSSRKAVDEWLMHLDRLFADLPPDASVRYIMDYQSGVIPPIAYGANQARLWLERNPDHCLSRVAFLHHSHLLANMLETAVRLLRAQRVTVRFFTSEADAIAWLLAE